MEISPSFGMYLFFRLHYDVIVRLCKIFSFVSLALHRATFLTSSNNIICSMTNNADMRKVRICPQTRFCGFDMCTLFAVYNIQFTRMSVMKRPKSIQKSRIRFACHFPVTFYWSFNFCEPICDLLLLCPHFFLKYVRKLGLQVWAFSHVWEPVAPNSLINGATSGSR